MFLHRIGRIPAWLWVAVAMAATAVCIDLSPFHSPTNPDTLIPILSSLYHWTPFYWECDRNGQLYGLLAMPFRHPFYNLLVQNGVAIFLSLGSTFVLTRYLFRDSTWAVMGGAAWIVLLLSVSNEELYQLLNGNQQYLVPVGLALAGHLLILRGRGWPMVARFGAGAFLIGLGYWCSVGLAMSIAPLAFGRRLFARWLDPEWKHGTRPANRELLVEAGLIFLGTAFGLALSVMTPSRETSFALTPWEMWPEGWSRLWHGLTVRYGTYLRTIGVVAALSLAWLAVPSTRTAAVRCWAGAGALVFLFAVQFLGVGCTSWLRRNNYDMRFIFYGTFGLGVAVAAILVGPPASRLSAAGVRRTARALVAALPAAAILAFGWPSAGAARAAIDRAVGRWTDDVLAARCTHVVGHYWNTWSAMFHTNMVLADRGDARIVWGVTFRSGPTLSSWSAVPREATRLGWLNDEEEARPTSRDEEIWRPHFPDVIECERWQTLWVFVPAQASPNPAADRRR